MAFHDTISWPGPEKVVEEALYKSRNFKDVRLSVQITYAKKVGRNTVKDMLESRYRLFARHLGNGYREFLQNMRTSGQRMRFPKPVRKILGHVLRLIE